MTVRRTVGRLYREKIHLFFDKLWETCVFIHLVGDLVAMPPSVYAFGNGDVGQLGPACSGTVLTPQRIPLAVAVQHIACGEFDSGT